MRKLKETVAKQLSIVQDYRYRYIYLYSCKTVKALNFFRNTAQLGNFFPQMWRSGAVVQWCGGAMILKVAHVAVIYIIFYIFTSFLTYCIPVLSVFDMKWIRVYIGNTAKKGINYTEQIY